jgi:hypothetical protein
MDGYAYGESEPVEKCPYCKDDCYADFVDIGVGGYQQCGPFHCTNCGASQIGPYDEERELTSYEKMTGWYEPGEEPGSSANVIDGKVVSYAEMKEVYRSNFEGNPAWFDSEYVKEWWNEIRKRT